MPCWLFFDVFASRVRMHILMSLWEKPRTVKEICKATGVEQSNVSHQLRLLQRCSVVQAQRKGKSVLYRLEGSTKPVIRAAERHIKKHCNKKCDDWVKRNKK